MDPLDPSSLNHRTAKLRTGRTYHFVDQTPENYDPRHDPTLLCVHGFPDSWYGWRYQIRPWTRKGARVVVPDMLGYGDTDKPFHASEYTTKKLCADLAALLDYLSIEKAILIGHDWGAFTVGRFALWYPQRLTALVILSVAYTPPSRSYIPLTEVAKRLPNLEYQTYFNSPQSTRDIEGNLHAFVQRIFHKGKHTGESLKVSKEGFTFRSEGSQPSLLSDKEFQFYVREFGKGMNGPLNYYRTSQYRHEEEAEAGLPSRPSLPENLPVLFLWGTGDSTATPKQNASSHKYISGLQEVSYEGLGHWLMIEAPEEITKRIADWLIQHSILKPMYNPGKL